jgi:hypothetical protein
MCLRKPNFCVKDALLLPQMLLLLLMPFIGRYLEIFARKNNLRNFWVSIGNEVTGTGLPEADVAALQQSNCIPGAVYGRGSGGASATAGAVNTGAAAAVAGK